MAPLQAATLERLSLDDMIAKSSAIVRGQVTGSYAAFNGNSILTHYSVNVVERWKGPEAAVADFVVPGGKVDRVRQVCPGAPELTQGKEYLLFLWTSRGGLTYIIGFSQGLFELPKDGKGDPVAVRAASGETILEPGTGVPVRNEFMEIRLSDLTSQVSARGARK